jgi:hypothetical protein
MPTASGPTEPEEAVSAIRSGDVVMQATLEDVRAVTAAPFDIDLEDHRAA